MHRIQLPDWRTWANLVTEVSDLPQWFDNQRLYLDLETTSEDDDKDSLNPWRNCKVLGISILVDEEREPYYIPLRHRGVNRFSNLPIEPVENWLRRVLAGSKLWVNHNVKYDAHVLYNSGFTQLPPLFDTIVLCKLQPEEERFTYDLTTVMGEWLYKNISAYEENIKVYLRRGRSTTKDYGVIPIDVMCPYAAVDALCVQALYDKLIKTVPEESSRIHAIENQVTQVLFDIENAGTQIDVNLVEQHNRQIPAALYTLLNYLEKETGFIDFRPHTNADCKELIVNRYGLPVLEWTDKKQPSFGADALLAYQVYAPQYAHVFDAILKFKELQKLHSSFTSPYHEKNVAGRIHSSYNQIVRTGRMSCRDPNMQQLSEEAKDYIVPFDKDSQIVDLDFSQIEFRLIAHFIKAEAVIAKYQEDPMADYHQVVADLCGIDRYPAKRINFMLGYGGGRGKCIEILASIPSIVGELKERRLIEERANAVYAKYHQMVPNLKPTTWKAFNTVRQRGYVRTLLGRHRHLGYKAHFKAFNTVIQGSAADLFKAALVRLAEAIKGTPVTLIGCVHDSFVLNTPIGYDVAPLIKVVEELPDGVNLRVPIRAVGKSSTECWRKCK